jgi:glutamate-ammonia-ligase adenylyltransferase
MTFDELTDSQLSALGLLEPERARRILFSLAGQGVTDEDIELLLPNILSALSKCPDADRALNNLERWMTNVSNRVTYVSYLGSHPTALDNFCFVCGSSQYFADILVRNPEYFDILARPDAQLGKSEKGHYRELSGFIDGIQRSELKLEAMRRFKQREILRIGTRDLMGIADMPAVAREFSDLADASIQKCYEVACTQLTERYPGEPLPPLIVIGMGKLGGEELNYSSDVDLMFVCGNPTESLGQSTVERAHKLAEGIINGLSKAMHNGHVFRVDMRLRPEGRFGALVRTLQSYQDYYESWAEPWELQALIKARPVAGDPALGQQYLDMIQPYIYRRSVPAPMLEAIRHNKERIEQKAEIERQSLVNVKVGPGGIRDIEFIVQRFQLMLGGRLRSLQTQNTLEGISRLRLAGELTPEEANDLTEDYIYLRTVEHRLQILYDRQTQSLPTDPEERRLLAKRLGYVGLEVWEADHARRTARVRGHFERLFLSEEEAADDDGGWQALLENAETDDAHAEITHRLADLGFVDPERAYIDLKTAAFGGDYGLADPDTKAVFPSMGGRLIDAASRTCDPDAALHGVEEIALAVPSRAQLYRSFADGDELLDRFCVLAAGSPPLIRILVRHLEWLDLLVSEEVIDPDPKSAEQCREELDDRLQGVSDFGKSLAVIGLYIQRERLRIGARDLWSEIAPLVVGVELSALASGILDVLLHLCVQRELAKTEDDLVHRTLSSLSVIGLGKLGGQELGYGSDWDCVLVYRRPEDCPDEAPQSVVKALDAVAEGLIACQQQIRATGAPLEIDLRLRPEGRFGALVYSVDQYADYYRNSALTWERQALTKARFVAGDVTTAEEYMAVAHAAIYSDSLTVDATAEIVAMKRRIENERLKVDQRTSDLKLGHGGMLDIEFTAQMLQLKHGAAHPTVRTSSTVSALHALATLNVIPATVVIALVETYRRLTATRNRLALLGSSEHDILPGMPRLRRLAISLGVTDTSSTPAEDELMNRLTAQMRETRLIVNRLFYGER